MDEKIQQALSISLLRIFKSLARLVLRLGMSYEQFDELAKQAFVEVVEKDFALPKRKQTDSRIAVVTGLSRKEVKRLRNLVKDHGQVPVQYNRAARVLNGWLRKADYLDEQQQPKVLPLEGESDSFTALVKEYGGDIPVRAVLDELLRIGAVQRDSNNHISLSKQAYIPTDNMADALVIIGTDTALLLDTLLHNFSQPAEKSYLQLKVCYNNLPAEALPVLSKLSSEEGQALLQKLNRWFALQDRDANPDVIGSGRYQAGVGIYFFAHEISENLNETT
ncbi:DUF6502 family protein [Candidatus Venteria ishoeyi]|uniref:Uncharacterized protein n=1 Tax=Candidatus Venteria ishoeyi TaxID=1899563 RepID=A0A1H6FC87_9GAMM|nr:DUF6502 family protein [Candidatus Venteria ishoeyi]SEH07001.1 Uncharacterised protein [Candidatus Venteria ishoeyi]